MLSGSLAVAAGGGGFVLLSGTSQAQRGDARQVNAALTSFPVGSGTGWIAVARPPVLAHLPNGTPAGIPGHRHEAHLKVTDALNSLASDGIPVPMLAAFKSAASRVNRVDPVCQLSWPLLAGIGRIESDDGRDVPPGGGMLPDGTIVPAILGPLLDGKDGMPAIPDTDPAIYDGSKVWSRAVGPMQFLPSTWMVMGVNSDGRPGVGDPENIWDATLAAGRYLCAAAIHLDKTRNAAAAVFSYNHSTSYVRLVLGLAAKYRHEVTTAAMPLVHRSHHHRSHHHRFTRHRHANPSASPSPSRSGGGSPSPSPSSSGVSPTPTGTTSPTASPSPTATPSPTAVGSPSAVGSHTADASPSAAGSPPPGSGTSQGGAPHAHPRGLR